MGIRWHFDPQGNLGTAFRYWHRQLTFISAEKTLQRVANCLEDKKPGAYLRFGRADIDTALGIQKNATELPESLILEIRKSFLLSGENIFKALHIDCPALGLPFRARAVGVSDREAIDRLNAVGACFLDWPVYSYTAFNIGGLEQQDLLEQFFESFKSCQPILVFKEGEAREEAIEILAPPISTAVPGEDIYKSIDRLEDDLWTAGSATNGFPVVVLALGVAGRVLVKRLMQRRFPGFLLDLDNLREIPIGTRSGVRVSRMLGQPHTKDKEKPATGTGSGEKLPLRWEGPFLGHYSYSIINRELCFRLGLNDKLDLSIRPSDTPFSIDSFDPANPSGFRSIVDRVGKPLTQAAQIHVSNHVLHPYLPPLEGSWVVILPWDYMSLPVRWLEWIRTEVDEVWVPSHFVRNAFLEGGIPQERVVVVPNGVDVRLYRPNAWKVKLNTRKTFKFLFVGGPFWRKGFDVLLEAYGKAFTARDDVSLVTKSVPNFWTSAGTKRLADFRSRVEAPEVLSIIHSLDQKRMAGLYASCNCLVHPYRAEGFAICVAEAMASGLPVIVTGIGGTTDFCNPRTAFLIPATLHKMSLKQLDNEPTLDYPTYAEPEVDALVEWMRHVYEHPQQSRAIGREGMNKIRTEFTWDNAAETAVQRLIALESKPVQRLKEK